MKVLTKYNPLFSKDILEIYVDNFPEYLRSKNRSFIRTISKYYKTYFIFSDNTLQGFAFVLYFPKIGMHHLDYIALSKKSQGKGFGKILINNILKNHNKLTLECEDENNI